MNLSEGWISWLYISPDSYLDGSKYPIEVRRLEWDHGYIIISADMNPETNVAGLYWRPTGIFKTFTKRQAYQQANANAQGLSSWATGLYGLLGGESK